jgi:predicted dehydrogenase
MLRIGLLGAGFIGRVHFNQYQQLRDRAEIVAICDAEAKRRIGDWSEVGGNIGDKQGRVQDLGAIRPVERWQDVVAADDVDVIDIALPTFLHAEVAVAALAAGKHVLCEKPMALTVEQCDRMIAAAADAPGTFMIAQCVRFWPEYVWLKQAEDSGRYGRLRAVNLRRQASTPDYSWHNWIVDPSKSGGAILDLHVHDVDYALHLLGKPKWIIAQGAYRDGALDRVHSMWHYSTDRSVVLEGWWDAPKGYEFNMGFTASFETATVLWDLATGKPMTVYHKDGRTEVPRMPAHDGYFAEIEYFLSCAAAGKPPELSTPRASRDAVAIALAEHESICTRKPIDIA